MSFHPFSLSPEYDPTSSLSPDEQWELRLRQKRQTKLGFSQEETDRLRVEELNQAMLKNQQAMLKNQQAMIVKQDEGNFSLKKQNELQKETNQQLSHQIQTIQQQGWEREQQHYEQIETARENAAMLVGSVENLSLDIQKRLYEVGDYLGNELQRVQHEQNQTNLLLKDVKEILRIPDFQKERIYFVEQGLKHYYNSQINDSLSQDALENFLKAEVLEKTDYIVLHKIGMIYLYSPNHINLEKAIDYFTRAAKYASAESDPNAIRIANKLLENNQLTEIDAEQGLQLLAAESYFQGSIASYLLKKYPLSIRLAESAYNLSPKNLDVQFHLSKCYLQDNQIDKGLVLLEKLLRNHPVYSIHLSNDDYLVRNKNSLELLERLFNEVNEKIKDKCNSLETESDKSLFNETKLHFITILRKMVDKKHPYLEGVNILEGALPSIEKDIYRSKSITNSCLGLINTYPDLSCSGGYFDITLRKFIDNAHNQKDEKDFSKSFLKKFEIDLQRRTAELREMKAYPLQHALLLKDNYAKKTLDELILNFETTPLKERFQVCMEEFFILREKINFIEQKVSPVINAKNKSTNKIVLKNTKILEEYSNANTSIYLDEKLDHLSSLLEDVVFITERENIYLNNILICDPIESYFTRNYDFKSKSSIEAYRLKLKENLSKIPDFDRQAWSNCLIENSITINQTPFPFFCVLKSFHDVSAKRCKNSILTFFHFILAFIWLSIFIYLTFSVEFDSVKEFYSATLAEKKLGYLIKVLFFGVITASFAGLFFEVLLYIVKAIQIDSSNRFNYMFVESWRTSRYDIYLFWKDKISMPHHEFSQMMIDKYFFDNSFDLYKKKFNDQANDFTKRYGIFNKFFYDELYNELRKNGNREIIYGFFVFCFFIVFFIFYGIFK